MMIILKILNVNIVNSIYQYNKRYIVAYTQYLHKGKFNASTVILLNIDWIFAGFTSEAWK